VIHHVFANRSNIGDWLSARAVQRLIGATTVVEHLCDEPFVPHTLAQLRAVKPDDFILIGGGGLFTQYFEPFWSGFESIAPRAAFAIWGVGCCDCKRTDSQPVWPRLAAIVRASRLCAVRDELTRAYLAPCALPPATACPSLTAVRARRPGWGILHVDSYDVVGAGVYEYMNAVTRQFAAASGRPFRRANNLVQAGSKAALAATLDLYAQSDVIVSSRLHGCVIGLAMGRRVIAVSGDRKVDAFMRDAGLGD
jgi:polysaccharide pyruvyl transferase WcaK-like protein